MKNLFIIVFSAILIFAFSFAVYSAFELAIEAELAHKIVPPITIGVPKDAKDKGGPEPDEPSNGRFIWIPGGPTASSQDNQGYIEFEITIPKKAKYAIWGRVIAWDGNSDSFWVIWRPADPDENPQQVQKQDYRWAVAQGNAWHWNRVNKWLDAGTFNREWELDKGDSVLRIYGREDATMLDCLFITDNLAADAGTVSARVPTKEEINAWIQGKQKLAVVSNGKISTTWASIKTW
ncbi:MAG: hypothetical protein ACPL7B_03650 [Candidatus Poribacteria bacterium]